MGFTSSKQKNAKKKAAARLTSNAAQQQVEEPPQQQAEEPPQQQAGEPPQQQVVDLQKRLEEAEAKLKAAEAEAEEAKKAKAEEARAEKEAAEKQAKEDGLVAELMKQLKEAEDARKEAEAKLKSLEDKDDEDDDEDEDDDKDEDQLPKKQRKCATSATEKGEKAKTLHFQVKAQMFELRGLFPKSAGNNYNPQVATTVDKFLITLQTLRELYHECERDSVEMHEVGDYWNLATKDALAGFNVYVRYAMQANINCYDKHLIEVYKEVMLAFNMQQYFFHVKITVAKWDGEWKMGKDAMQDAVNKYRSTEEALGKEFENAGTTQRKQDASRRALDKAHTRVKICFDKCAAIYETWCDFLDLVELGKVKRLLPYNMPSDFGILTEYKSPIDKSIEDARNEERNAIAAAASGEPAGARKKAQAKRRRSPTPETDGGYESDASYVAPSGANAAYVERDWREWKEQQKQKKQRKD